MADPCSLDERRPLVAIDIGNSRVKLGLFDAARQSSALPEPSRTLDLIPAADSNLAYESIRAWLAPLPPSEPDWAIGSVQRTVSANLLAWLSAKGAGPVTLLSADDLPLRVGVPRPDLVGMDRLLNVVAAARLKPAERPAIVIDVGTAITVDLAAADGSFLGGAIMPGIATSARALHQFTDLLPLVQMSALGEAPDPLGTGTLEALHSGLFWGAVGGIRELIARLSSGIADNNGLPPTVLLTGGAAPAVAGLLGTEARFVPHLTLAGIAIAARRS